MVADTLGDVPRYDLEAWRRLAAAVHDRRVEIGWTQAELADEAKVSETTIVQLESHARPKRSLTLGAIEQALRWQRGSARRVLEGDEPVLVVVPPEAPRPDQLVVERPDGMSEEDWEELRGLLVGTMQTWRHIRRRDP